jgi:histidyl-tRNA synthetase
VGSIAGGGRYDDLIGIFGSTRIPAVGFSIGVERVFSILESKAKKDTTFRVTDTDVMVASIDKGLLKERMKICNELWGAKIKAEFLLKEAKLPPQLSYAEQSKIPFAVVIGGREVEQGVVQVKNLGTRQQETVPRNKLVETLQQKIDEYYKSLPASQY